MSYINLLDDEYGKKTYNLLFFSVGLFWIMLFLDVVLRVLAVSDVEYKLTPSIINFLNFIFYLSFIVGIVCHSIGIYRLSNIGNEKRLFIFYAVMLGSIVGLFLLFRYAIGLEQTDLRHSLFGIFIPLLVLSGAMIYAVIKYFKHLIELSGDKIFRLAILSMVASITFDIMLVVTMVMKGGNYIILLFMILGISLLIVAWICYGIGFIRLKTINATK